MHSIYVYALNKVKNTRRRVLFYCCCPRPIIEYMQHGACIGFVPCSLELLLLPSGAFGCLYGPFGAEGVETAGFVGGLLLERRKAKMY